MGIFGIVPYAMLMLNKYLVSVIGKIISQLEDFHVIKPGMFEHVTWHSKKYFEDPVKDFKMGIIQKYSNKLIVNYT